MPREIMEKGAAGLGLDLPGGALASFEAYLRMLERKNQVMDLTAVTDIKDMARLHILDSIALLKLLPRQPGSVIDVGTGAGLPGLPLAIALPDARVCLMDARQKRVDFLCEVRDELGLDNAFCLCARAEELGLDPEYREGFDIAVARAVSRLNELCELCLPLVKPGGRFIAMKGRDSDEEIAEAARAMEILGARPGEIYDYPIPDTDIVHRAVVIEKIAPTPAGYPRRYAKISRKPL